MKSTMEYFREISAIPRASGHEEKIADFICSTAEKNGLFYRRDSHNNVFVRKPASQDKQNMPSVLLAAHTDMVCEKTSESGHDFSSDPLTLIEKNGFVSALATTLGADNGGGVAVMLRLMEDGEASHPQTEFLFTSSEETGMQGAENFDYSLVSSDYIINLDSEKSATACIGCAGGSRYKLRIPVERTRKAEKLYKINISGLAGGHSGVDITKNRKNALKILGTMLFEIHKNYPMQLAQLCGGGKDNVIPVSAYATFELLKNTDIRSVKELCASLFRSIQATLEDCDLKHFRVTLKSCNPENEEVRLLSFKSTYAVISALTLAPYGITEIIPGSDMPSASINPGVGNISDEDFEMVFLSRFGADFSDRCTENLISSTATLLGGTLNKESSYPGWPYRRGSALQSAFEKACLEVYGKTAVFESVHAGLECGIFSSRLTALGKSPDIISIGPDLYSIHTVNEKMNIDSLEKLYSAVCRTIECIN